MWAVINDATGEAIPVSMTKRGAKNYASRHGYKWVGKIHEYSWAVTSHSIKTSTGWINSDFQISTKSEG